MGRHPQTILHLLLDAEKDGCGQRWVPTASWQPNSKTRPAELGGHLPSSPERGSRAVDRQGQLPGQREGRV